MSMLFLAAFLVAGFAVGRFIRLPNGIVKVAGVAVTVILFLLVFLLGFKLGGNGSLISQFSAIGISSLTLGIGCTLGSVLLAGGYAALLALRRRRKS